MVAYTRFDSEAFQSRNAPQFRKQEVYFTNCPSNKEIYPLCTDKNRALESPRLAKTKKTLTEGLEISQFGEVIGRNICDGI
jgi:predicted enzyme involved in methoxymalonyl-ACP biosynthesis